MTTFAELTTLRVGGDAARLVRATSEAEILAVADSPDLLVVSGGSNLLVGDQGFAGTVLQIATTGISIDSDACSGATIKLAAGEEWSSFVEYAVDNGMAGVETLAGIPGLVGAAVIQNIGAYGREIAGSIARVRAYDRSLRAVTTLAGADCGFAYRTSRFKSDPDRWVILDVTLQLRVGSESDPIKYQELADALGVKMGERAPLVQVRDAVMALRRRKGMVLDPTDRDTWSAGSFFTNPVITRAQSELLPVEAPTWPLDDGVKVSAAWLIEQAGFPKGYRLRGAAISSKHSLALVNADNATAADLIALATAIRSEVRAKFDIQLELEVRLVGLDLG
ncbi:MAG TPA: UDP-N-acetylmuramate dehydrogenase [Candidatus Nanopelagicaceae bacterium]|nr:UDP-N-acetylmuramate dehydrogenase [Candidatus Nanopelagicaceae bacterium]